MELHLAPMAYLFQTYFPRIVRPNPDHLRTRLRHGLPKSDAATARRMGDIMMQIITVIRDAAIPLPSGSQTLHVEVTAK